MDNKNVWFTADLHLGHSNIAGPRVSKWPAGYRDFDSVEDMNEELIRKVNQYVGQEDILYHLGDFSYKGGPVSRFRSRIICQNIIMIVGNHDKKSELQKVFGDQNVHDVLRSTIGKQEVFMSHYSMRVWPSSHRGSWCLYGHSHSRLEDQPWGKSMDVGTDNAKKLYGEYRPFSFHDIESIMDRRSVKELCHKVKL